jgi:hypothetical protein
MIVCSCNRCAVSCGRTFETIDEYRKFCYDKFISRYPSDRILGYQPIIAEKDKGKEPLQPPSEE